MPVVVCHAPSRMRRCSSARLRTVAIINPHASSGVASRTEAESGMGEVRVGDQDPALGGRGHVQVGQAPADDGDQLQVGQPLDERAWKRHALAQGAHHIERRQYLGGLRLGQVPVENGDVGPGPH